MRDLFKNVVITAVVFCIVELVYLKHIKVRKSKSKKKKTWRSKQDINRRMKKSKIHVVK
ncbi:hypothetical protein KAR91_22055 [Candidatus Pacearchaeota archaeon]|nr:hypothetical protein [Candidatus Pacearchaeota archaeon]